MNFDCRDMELIITRRTSTTRASGTMAKSRAGVECTLRMEIFMKESGLMI